jgi:signal transduction histidine kinase
MFELRRPSLRLTTGLALLVAGIVEMHTMTTTLRGQAQLQERVVRSVRASVATLRPRLQELLRKGDAVAWRAAIEEARSAGLGRELAVLSADGSVLAARPAPGPAPPSWSDDDKDLLAAEGDLTLGPLLGGSVRLVSYIGFRTDAGLQVLFVATPVPEVVEDLRDRRTLLISHALVLGLLAVAGALAAFPDRPAARSIPTAESPFEVAMQRLHDVSQRDKATLHRVEEELREKSALARAGELAAGVAHEIRNGIGAISGYARLIEGSADAAAQESARAIREECRTLTTVTDRFMEFVRDEKLNRAPFDLGRMLSRVVARERRAIPDADVGVRVLGTVQIEGDEELLERSFENIVRNACQAVGDTGQVRVEAANEEGRVVVRVSDDGPGLSGDAESPLRPFFTTKAGGSGLGLPIALKIVRLHQGTLELKPGKPRGLVVEVRLPVNESLPKVAVQPANGPADGGPSNGLSS